MNKFWKWRKHCTRMQEARAVCKQKEKKHINCCHRADNQCRSNHHTMLCMSNLDAEPVAGHCRYRFDASYKIGRRIVKD